MHFLGVLKGLHSLEILQALLQAVDGLGEGNTQVRGDVLGEVVCPGKLLPAHLAGVGFFACVDAEVAVHVRPAPKRLAAHAAVVGFFPRVGADVELEVFAALKAFGAVGALEGSLLLLGEVG